MQYLLPLGHIIMLWTVRNSLIDAFSETGRRREYSIPPIAMVCVGWFSVFLEMFLKSTTCFTTVS